MKTITRKGDILAAVESCREAYLTGGVSAGIGQLQDKLLEHKVKFPLLESAAALLAGVLPAEAQLRFCDEVAALHTIGGNVLIGILLQKRLDENLSQSFAKAAEYIEGGEQWYVCDIIGERVFGYALLHQPERAWPEIVKLSTHSSFWVVRSLGAGGHYAIKKGLEKGMVARLFGLLLSLSGTQNKEVRQGVGWAAKTTAKFHPDVIGQYAAQIGDTAQVPHWFRNKINIGLARHRHAQGD